MAGLDLRHGDCLDLLRDIPDASVDCVLTDHEISRRRLEPLAQHYIIEADHA